jgi:hypothetical protein
MEKTYSVPVNMNCSFVVTVTMDVPEDWDEDDITDALENLLESSVYSMEMADGQYNLICDDYEFQGNGSYEEVLTAEWSEVK